MFHSLLTLVLLDYQMVSLSSPVVAITYKIMASIYFSHLKFSLSLSLIFSVADKHFQMQYSLKTKDFFNMP